VQSLIEQVDGYFGMKGTFVPKGLTSGEIVYFSPTNVRLFSVTVRYSSSKGGWMVSVGFLLDSQKLYRVIVPSDS
jgi:hypothetical protein